MSGTQWALTKMATIIITEVMAGIHILSVGTKVFIWMSMLNILTSPLQVTSLWNIRHPTLSNAWSHRWAAGGKEGSRVGQLYMDINNWRFKGQQGPFSVYNRPSVKLQKGFWCLTLELSSMHNKPASGQEEEDWVKERKWDHGEL